MNEQNIFENLQKAITSSVEELKPVPAALGNVFDCEIISFDGTEKDNRSWRELVAKYIFSAKNFEIHCWEDEQNEIALALGYGKVKPSDWKHGTIISGEVTPEFTEFILAAEKPADCHVYNKMTPFFSIFLDNGFSSEHYGTENIIRSQQEQEKNDVFRIDVDGMQWIGGSADDPHDLCLHGHVKVQIGDTQLDDHGTVSSTALYLLKTLTENKIMSELDIQMIPCCGHTLFANKELTEVTVSGCDKGTDWSTFHLGNFVKLILPNGKESTVSLADYAKEVFAFADKVEAFYNACSPKILPDNEFDRNGYIAFWNEWHRRRALDVSK